MRKKRIHTSAQGLAKIRRRTIRVIGLGGIGSHLVLNLGRFLWSQNAKSLNIKLDLIDGDHYELKNKARMPFHPVEGYTNKAVVQAIELANEFEDRLHVKPISSYVTERNIETLIQEKDVIFLAVDNHQTRKLVSDRCEQLNAVVLFSAGNDGIEAGEQGTFGNVQIFERRNGKNFKNPITRFHPEIKNPADRAPNEIGCEALAESSAPQLLFTNLAVASAMLNAFYAWLHGKARFEEVYLDILEVSVRPVIREVVAEHGHQVFSTTMSLDEKRLFKK